MVAGVSFCLCAFNVVWLSHGVHVAVAALPWAILAIERILRSGRLGDAVALAVVMAIALAGPPRHPGSPLRSGRCLRARPGFPLPNLPGRQRLRRLGLVGGGMASARFSPRS